MEPHDARHRALASIEMAPAKDRRLMTTKKYSRSRHPVFERLEVRDVPSALGMASHASAHNSNGPNLNLVVETNNGTGAAVSNSDRGATTGDSSGVPPWVNESYLQSLVGQLYGPVTTTTPITVGSQTFPAGTYSVPQPTPSEVKRETFWVEFDGHYTVGPPRFSDQAATVHIYSNGRSAASSQFLSGRAQILLFPPADPTATPTTLDPMAGRVAGLMSVFSANILQSGTVLFAETTNVAGVASNDPGALDHGLPSRLQFTIDPGGVSGGVDATPAYTTTPATVTNATTGQAVGQLGGNSGAVAFNQGTGIVDIKYIPDQGRHGVVSQAGKVVVRVQGLINTTGVLNPIYKGIN